MLWLGFGVYVAFPTVRSRCPLRLSRNLFYGAPAMRDLAILVRDLKLDDALQWLAQRVGPAMSVGDPEPPCLFFDVGPHRLVVTAGIEDGPFSELWFSTGRPWPNAAAFAHEAAGVLGSQVLYELPGALPCDWRSVSPDGAEADVIWDSGPVPAP